jgi:hypothetical protein
MLRFSVHEVLGKLNACFDEEPEPRKWLLYDFIDDMYGQEDYYLGEIAKAEAGETILNLYNNWVDAQLYPDGRVILEEMRWSDDDEAELGPPARTELTLAEAKQLILDWIAAKKKWREEQGARKVASVPGR